MTTKMKTKPILRDRESGELLSMADIEREFDVLRDMGATDAETVEDYIHNITSKNGTCDWLENEK